MERFIHTVLKGSKERRMEKCRLYNGLVIMTSGSNPVHPGSIPGYERFLTHYAPSIDNLIILTGYL